MSRSVSIHRLPALITTAWWPRPPQLGCKRGVEIGIIARKQYFHGREVKQFRGISLILSLEYERAHDHSHSRARPRGHIAPRAGERADADLASAAPRARGQRLTRLLLAPDAGLGGTQRLPVLAREGDPRACPRSIGGQAKGPGPYGDTPCHVLRLGRRAASPHGPGLHGGLPCQPIASDRS